MTLLANILYRHILILIASILTLWGLPAVALESNKDLKLNDNDGDSPQVILVDAEKKQLVIEKLDSGAANLFNNEGSICLSASNDRDDIICFATKANKPGIIWSLADVSDEAEPGIQVSSDGKLQYRNKAGSWADFDSLKSSFEIEDGSITSSKLDAAVGTSGQVLSITSNGALKWVTPDAGVIDDNAITSSKIADESVSTVDLAANAVTSVKISDATIVNADINASAAIAGTKIAPDFGAQLVNTTGDISGANITATGDVTVGNAKGLKLSDADGNNYMTLQAPNSVTSDMTLTLPASAGSDGQVLQTDGTGMLSWASAAADTSLSTANQTLTANRTIELGSNTLTVSGTGTVKLPDASIGTDELAADAVTAAKLATGAVDSDAIADASIVAVDIATDAIATAKLLDAAVTSSKIEDGTVVNADINASAAIAGTKIAPDFGAQLVTTTGNMRGANITATGDVTVDNAKSLKLAELDSNGSNTIALKAPNSVTSDMTLTLPSSAGSDGQVLQTDGTGMLSWASAAADTSLSTANQTLTADRTIELGSNTLTVSGTGTVKLPDASIGTDELAADAVTAAKLATGAVDSDAIADASIVAVDIATDAIATAKLLDAAVTSAKIEDGTIVNADINASAAIAGTKIAPDFGAQLVTTTGNMRGANITSTGDVTVDNAKSLKLAELDSNGSNTIALKAPNSVTSDTTLTLPSSAGSDGQVLQTDGTGMLSWASAAADTSLSTANQTLTADRTIELGSNTLTVSGTGTVKLPDASIGTDELAADAVTAAKLATGAVDSDAIADASIVAVDIATDAIATAKLLDAAVTSAKLEDGTVVNADINASAAIEGTKIAPDFGAQLVTTTGNMRGANITSTGDVTVDNAKSLKLAELDSNGSNTIALKAPNSVTSDTTLTLPSSAGSDGQVLQTDGTGMLSWASVAADTSLSTANQTLMANRTIELGSNTLTVSGTGTVKLPDASIGTDELAVDAVTAAKLATGAVDSDAIADASIVAVDIATDAIATAKLLDAAVTSAKLEDGTVVNADINASAAIEGTKIAPDFGAQLVTTTGNMSGANITAIGDVTVGNAKSLRLPDANGSNYITLRAPNNLLADATLILPDSVGSDGQVMQANDDGTLSWIDAAVDTSLATANQTLTASRTIRLGSNSLTVEGTGANVTLPNSSISTAELAADAVTSAKLADGAVTLAKLATGAVNSNAIVDASIVGSDIAANAITTTNILDAAVTSAKLAGSSVETVTLAADAVTSNKIADGAIVNVDINDSAAIAGTKIEPDFGPQSVITTGNISGVDITATGDVTVGNAKGLKLADADGTNYMILQAPTSVDEDTTLILPDSAGSAGQVLQTNGNGTLSWSNAAMNTSLATANQALTADRTIELGTNTLTVTGTGALKLPDESISTAELASDAVTSAKLADGTIVNADINNAAAIAGTKIAPNFGAKSVTTTGDIGGANLTATGDVTVGNAKGLKLADADGSHYMTLQAPNTLNLNTRLTLPNGPGAPGQVLQTNGNGGLAWSDVATDTSLANVNQTLTASRTINLGSNTLTVAGTGANLILPDGVIDTDELATQAVTSAKLRDDSVTAAKLALNSVDSGSIADASIRADDIAINAITVPKILDGAVTSSKLSNNAVTAAKLATDAVNSDAIIDASIATIDIANDAVTSAKIANDTVVNADINASAAIAGTKIAPDFGNQLVSTDNYLNAKRLYSKELLVVGKSYDSTESTAGQLRLYWGPSGSNNSSTDIGYVDLRVSTASGEPMTYSDRYILGLPSQRGQDGQVLQLSGNNGDLIWSSLETKATLSESERSYLSPGALSAQGVRERGDCDMSNGGNDDYEEWIPMIEEREATPGRNDGWENHEYGFCVDKQHRPEGRVSWGEAYRYCARDNKRLLDYYQWRMACDQEFVDAPVYIPGILPWTKFTLAPGYEWASYPHPIHYIEYDGNSKKTITGVGAVVGGGQTPEADAAPDVETDVPSCANLKTVKIRWIERQDNGPFVTETADTTHPSWKVYNDKNQGPEKHYFRCAW